MRYQGRELHWETVTDKFTVVSRLVDEEGQEVGVTINREPGSLYWWVHRENAFGLSENLMLGDSDSEAETRRRCEEYLEKKEKG